MRLAIVGMLAMLATGAAAQDRLSAIDVAVDHEALAGKRVDITGCVISNASVHFAWCSLQTPQGSAGEIYIDAASMERRLLRFALNHCVGFDVREECRTDLRATVGTQVGGGAMLSDVEWIETPPTN